MIERIKKTLSEENLIIYEALVDEGFDEWNVIANILQENVYAIEGHDFKDFADYYIDSCGGFEGLSDDIIEGYLNYNELGKFINKTHYNEEAPEENAGQYWCGREYATDYEIGIAVLERLGIEELRNLDECEYLFDYDSFGRDMSGYGNYVYYNGLIINYDNFDESLGFAFEERMINKIKQ